MSEEESPITPEDKLLKREEFRRKLKEGKLATSLNSYIPSNEILPAPVRRLPEPSKVLQMTAKAELAQPSLTSEQKKGKQNEQKR